MKIKYDCNGSRFIQYTSGDKDTPNRSYQIAMEEDDPDGGVNFLVLDSNRVKSPIVNDVWLSTKDAKLLVKALTKLIIEK